MTTPLTGWWLDARIPVHVAPCGGTVTRAVSDCPIRLGPMPSRIGQSLTALVTVPPQGATCTGILASSHHPVNGVVITGAEGSVPAHGQGCLNRVPPRRPSP